MRSRRAGLALLMLCLAALASGCWDRRELEQLAFVTALGFDLGRQNELRVTAVIANPAALAGGGGQGRSGGAGTSATPAAILATTDGRTIPEAIRKIDQSLSRRTTFLQLQLIVFSEELARKGGIARFDFVTRFRELRRSTLVAVAEGTAEDYFNLKPAIETDPVRLTAQLITGAGSNAGPPITRLNDFILRAASPGGNAGVTLIGIKKNTRSDHIHVAGADPFPDRGRQAGRGVAGQQRGRGGETGPQQAREEEGQRLSTGEVKGTAVFRGDDMVERLNHVETFYYTVATGRLRGVDWTYPVPGRPGRWVAVRFVKNQPQVRAGWSGGRPRIELTLPLVLDVAGYQGTASPTDPRTRERLQEAIKRDVERGILQVVRKTQRKKADIFGWGDAYRSHFATYPEFLRLRWAEKYPQARVVVNVIPNIARTGTTFEPPSVVQ